LPFVVSSLIVTQSMMPTNSIAMQMSGKKFMLS
jgi:hypothetical protein